MTYIPDVHDYTLDASEPVKEFLSEQRRKAITSEIEQVVDEEFDRFEDYANEFISNVAADRAELFFDKVLGGDDKAAMVLLGDQNDSSRYQQGGCCSGAPWASLIHGRLFETGGIKMRRKIVEAHADLITSERIKDLESIVDGLDRQIRKQNQEINDLRGRL